MREKFIKFMEGRYGVDAFAKFTMGFAFVAIILSMFIRNRVGAACDTLGLLAILYTYYRMLSRDIQKRYAENQKYLSITSGIRQWFCREKNLMQQRRISHLFLSELQTEDPYSERKRQDRDRLSKCHEIYQKS